MFDEINKKINDVYGIDKLDSKHQQEVMERVGVIVYEEILLKALEKMDEQDRDSFDSLSESHPEPDVIFKFLSEKVSNLSDIVQDTILSLKEESEEIIESITK